MTMYRKKAGPEFDAMEFDGSHESAKAIFSWVGNGHDSQCAYWSSNQTMTFPWAQLDNQQYGAGDWVVKRPGGLYRIWKDVFSFEYEAVA